MAPDQGGAKVARLILKVHHYRPNLTIWTASSRRLRARRNECFGLGSRYQPRRTSPRPSRRGARFLDRGRFWSLASGLFQFLRSRRVIFALARRAGEHGDDWVPGADARVDRVARSGVRRSAARLSSEILGVKTSTLQVLPSRARTASSRSARPSAGGRCDSEVDVATDVGLTASDGSERE